MNSINQKILELIQKDEDIRNHLFLYSELNGKQDFSIFFSEENDYSYIDWLYISQVQSATLIGVNSEDNFVNAIDDEGNLVDVCIGLENVPYEFIRINCQYTEKETVEEYFHKYKNIDIGKILKKYEQWCQNNGITLDMNKDYHDEGGNLFSEYFEKE